MRPGKSSKPSIEDAKAPAYVQDVISTLYYVRAQPLKVGKYVDVAVLNGTDTHQMRFQVRREEKIETVIGTVSCLVIEPLFENEHGFGPNPKATAFLWLTNDTRHVPVKISAELPFGHIDATLTSYKAK